MVDSRNREKKQGDDANEEDLINGGPPNLGGEAGESSGVSTRSTSDGLPSSANSGNQINPPPPPSFVDVDELINFSMSDFSQYNVPPKKRPRPRRIPKAPPPPVISEGGHKYLKNRAAAAGSPKKKPKPVPLPPTIHQTPPLTQKNLQSSKDAPSSNVSQRPQEADIECVAVLPLSSSSQAKPIVAESAPSSVGAKYPEQMFTIRQFFQNYSLNSPFPTPSHVARIDCSLILLPPPLLPSLPQPVASDSVSSIADIMSPGAQAPLNSGNRGGRGSSPPTSSVGSKSSAVPPIALNVKDQKTVKTPSSPLQVRTSNSSEASSALLPPVDESAAHASTSNTLVPATPARHGHASAPDKVSVEPTSVSPSPSGKNSAASSALVRREPVALESPGTALKCKTSDAYTQTEFSVSALTEAALTTCSSTPAASSALSGLPASLDHISTKSSPGPGAIPAIPGVSQLKSVECPAPRTYSRAASANISTVEAENAVGDESETSSHSGSSIIMSGDDEFPPLAFVQTPAGQDDAGDTCDSGESQNWRHGLTPSERFNYLRLHPARRGEEYHDLIFEVGNTNEKIFAHSLMLSTVSPCIKSELNKGRAHQRKPHTLKFPGMDPASFRDMIDVMYTGTLPDFELGRTHELMKAARAVGFAELESLCRNMLHANLSVNNTVEYYHLAVTKKDKGLKKSVLDILASNAWDVFNSENFRQLSKEKLQLLLKSDDFYLDEGQIFEAIKRWATDRISVDKEVEPTGAQLREAMGDLLYDIRFPTMSFTDFFKIEGENQGIFDCMEVVAMSRYLARKEGSNANLDLAPSPPRFSCVPRKKVIKEPPASFKRERSPSPPPSPPDDNLMNQGDHHDNMEIESAAVGEELPNSPDPLSPNGEVDVVNEVIEVDQPKKKKRKLDKGNSIGNGSVDYLSTVPLLSKYVQQLRATDEVEKIQSICAHVRFVSCNPTPVYLPNLKKFNLRLIHNSKDQAGAVFKSTWKTKLDKLSELLFFETLTPSREGGNVLEQLLAQRVDVEISVHGPQKASDTGTEDITLVKVNHEEGILILNLIKDAQKIINGAGNFHLKVLALSDCEVESLNPIRKDQLEVIVLRKVKGLKNRADFLQSCPNLREICWNNLEKENFDFSGPLWNTNLRKLSLSKCKITTTPSFQDNHNLVEELYLDNCSWDENFVSSLPQIFPFVKRIVIYGTSNSSYVLLSILKIPSIEWILLWEHSYMYYNQTSEANTKKKKPRVIKVATEETKQVQEFLRGVFGDNFSKQEKSTFILQSKQGNRALQGTSSGGLQQWDRMDASNWTGEGLTKDNKFERITKVDFDHNSYIKFFPNFEVFQWFETPKSMYNAMQKRNTARSQSTATLGNSSSISEA